MLSEIVWSQNTPPVVEEIRSHRVKAFLNVAKVTDVNLKIVIDIYWEDRVGNVCR